MLQVNLTGFLEAKTPDFVKELWTLLLSAQDNISGIPAKFIEEKKEEIRKMKVRSKHVLFPFLLPIVGKTMESGRSS